MENKAHAPSPTFESAVLLMTVFVVGLCTIIYELLIGSVSSYFLGDSVKQFSITIGLTMTAMGIGTLLSRYIQQHLLRWFIAIEILLGVVGGLSVPLLFGAYSYTSMYYPIMVMLILVIGTFIGLEIPLLTRIMEKHYALRANISNVLSLDYFGAFAATLLFPFFLLPFFGIFKSSLITGGLNVAVGMFTLWCFRSILDLRNLRMLPIAASVAAIILVGMFWGSQSLIHAWETTIYDDRVIYSQQSTYQKVVLTKHRDDVRLYLDGNLQFSSIDEYRYHEALVHVPMGLTSHRENILILGGGDGLAAREVLKYADVKAITLVDLDPLVTELASTHEMIRHINHESFGDERVKVVNHDAYQYLLEGTEYFDVIIADLPDPKNSGLSRLYSREFYKLAKRRLAKQGIFVTQSTSPFFAKQAFWCIHETLKTGGFPFVRPYHAYVPSFGDWGFILASHVPLSKDTLTITVPTRFVASDNVEGLFVFSKDLMVEDIRPSSLDDPTILQYYLDGWKYWN